MNTVGEALAQIAGHLKDAGLDGEYGEARILLAESLGLSVEKILGYPEAPIDSTQAQNLLALAQRRAAREPMSHILGHKEFWSLDFKVSADTLTPRPDSETLIEAVLEKVEDKTAPLSILDLGTGTGCLLLTLLHELPNAKGVGVDKSPEALSIASENAEALGLSERVDMRPSDWFSAVSERFDIVISNPPYIREEELAELEPEVSQYEPISALIAGNAGLADYQRIINGLGDVLALGGFAAFELGKGQANPVSELAKDKGWLIAGLKKDLAGIERCLIIEGH